ncbi:hypothetical protein [Rhodovarius sp.]|uniref:hypothetical protein n=1 Tax=Rhodovarius sp. TaxID=2972673 RepID=UPI0034A2FA8B
MAAKRKTKTSKPKETMGPSKWRLQHGGFGEAIREADPETGTPVLHRRAVDTLGMMLANGTITQQMHDSGEIFRGLFRRAALDGMARSPLIRLPGKAADALSERNIDARHKVAEALNALGGHDSAAGSCAWHVVGLEMSVREWAMRQGWDGRPVAPPQAQGMLVATLSVLAGHFGLVSRTRVA